MCQEGDNTIFWYDHPKYTDDPTDSGTGKQIRFWFGCYLYEWLWDYVNMNLWYLGLFHYSH